MIAYAQKLRQACAILEGVDNNVKEKQNSLEENSEYINKLRESCKKIYTTDSIEIPEQSDSEIKEFLSKRTSSGLRHCKFLLAKRELQQLKEQAIARSKAILEAESIESKDIYAGGLRTEASHKMFCISSCVQTVQDTPTSYPEKFEESRSFIKSKPTRIQPKPILKKNPSQKSDEVKNTSRKAINIKRVSLDPLLVFWDCALEGDLIGLKKAFKFISNINEANSMGVTALHNAAYNGNKECVEFLIKNKSDVNCTDTQGWTALHYAAYAGYTDVCAYLISNGANVFSKTYDSNETAEQLCRKDITYNICYEFIRQIMEKMITHNKTTVYATHNYQAKFTDELSIEKGEELKVVNRTIAKEPDYWYVENKVHARGLVPKIFLTLYPINIATNSRK